jgi:hypothetical protein
MVGQGVGGVWFVANPATTPAAPSGSEFTD